MNESVSAGQEIHRTLDYLSMAIFRIRLTTNKELGDILDKEKLDGLDFEMANLSAAMINCFIIAIELGARKIKG